MFEPVAKGVHSHVRDTKHEPSSVVPSSTYESACTQTSSRTYSELTSVLRAPKLYDQPREQPTSQTFSSNQIRAEFPVKNSINPRLRTNIGLEDSSGLPKVGTQHGITASITRPSIVNRVSVEKRWVDEDITHYGAIEENCDDFDEWVDRVDVSKFAKDISVDLMSRPRLMVKKERNQHIVSPYPKPGWSYSNLIALALKNSESGHLTVSEIYAFMLEHFPYFRTAPSGWKNSVRHNLSLNKCFCKVEVDEDISLAQQTRKSCLWMINPERLDKIEHDIRKWRERNPDTATEGMARPEDLQAIEEGTKGLPVPERNSKQALKTVWLGNRSMEKESVYVNKNDIFTNEDAVAAEDLLNIDKDDYFTERNGHVSGQSLFALPTKSEPVDCRVMRHSKPVTVEDVLPTTFPPTETLVGTSSFNRAKRPRTESFFSPIKEIPVVDLLPSTFVDAFLSITPPKPKQVDPDVSLSPVRESGFRDAHDALNDNSLLATALEQSPYKLPVTFPVL
ncbi:fork head domain protein [Necator americanus]|uniref:Fork head domain protein n=1 Tax=Necator americanus TaxID=51031 RepID=W2SWX3_NECAM|nr:fork head domain protein [Necator americanus]ETN73311.1 fork head domain protein [Necator americanus]